MALAHKRFEREGTDRVGFDGVIVRGGGGSLHCHGGVPLRVLLAPPCLTASQSPVHLAELDRHILMGHSSITQWGGCMGITGSQHLYFSSHRPMPFPQIIDSIFYKLTPSAPLQYLNRLWQGRLEYSIREVDVPLTDLGDHREHLRARQGTTSKGSDWSHGDNRGRPLRDDPVAWGGAGGLFEPI